MCFGRGCWIPRTDCGSNIWKSYLVVVNRAVRGTVVSWWLRSVLGMVRLLSLSGSEDPEDLRSIGLDWVPWYSACVPGGARVRCWVYCIHLIGTSCGTPLSWFRGGSGTDRIVPSQAVDIFAVFERPELFGPQPRYFGTGLCHVLAVGAAHQMEPIVSRLN